jgi:hypothetical protein
VWILTTPYRMDGEEDRARSKQLTTAWQAILAAQAYRRGWSWDSEVGNLDRLMKLPGSINRKEGHERLAGIGPGAGIRYDFDHLIAVADRLAPAARELLAQAAQEQQHRRAERLGIPAASTAASAFSDPFFTAPANHDGPFDVLHDTAAWADIFQDAGWTYRGLHSDGREKWLRPAGSDGAPDSEYSLLCDEHVAVNWSERSGLPVGRQDPGNKLTKGRLYAELYCGGDTRAAAADILRAAVGTPTDGPAGRLPRHVLDEVARRCQPGKGTHPLAGQGYGERRKTAKGDAGRRLSGLIDNILKAVEGERSSRLRWSARRCAEMIHAGDLTPAQAESALTEVARRAGIGHHEAESIIRSAFPTTGVTS